MSTVTLKINGIETTQEKGTSLLEAARFLGIPIPTLCDMEGLKALGACRLCVVEIGRGERAKVVSSCTYPVENGLEVFTSTERILHARKMIVELLLATCPQSKTIQDLASELHVTQQRFRQEYEDCIMCGKCVRICEEQMMAKAIGFIGRGEHRAITTPFDMHSEVCRQCGACMYVCPACELRCTYTEPEKAICGGCLNLGPPCVEQKGWNDMMCYMEPCVACEIAPDGKKPKAKGE
jgi:bidirectional [NiFe] hydrogenase diaphorase subunit